MEVDVQAPFLHAIQHFGVIRMFTPSHVVVPDFRLAQYKVIGTELNSPGLHGACRSGSHLNKMTISQPPALSCLVELSVTDLRGRLETRECRHSSLIMPTTRIDSAQVNMLICGIKRIIRRASMSPSLVDSHQCHDQRPTALSHEQLWRAAALHTMLFRCC